MGNWHISIQGTGAHHNTDYPADANEMMRTFVASLGSVGHIIESATFTYGAREDQTEAGRSAWQRHQESLTASVEPKA